MMGQHSRSEALFYYFRLDDQVPETHLLRLIDLTPFFVDFAGAKVYFEESGVDTAVGIGKRLH
jgi:hypothetical protein